MKLLSWNVRDQENLQAIRRLRHTLRLHKPQAIFLMEKVRRHCGYTSRIEISSKGSKSGLCLAWKENVRIKLRSSANFSIDSTINFIKDDVQW